MSPRKGGEADKFGNRFEGVWTVRHLLYVLVGRIDSVTVEEPGELGEGVEFTVRRGNTTEVHQAKRQLGSANNWTLQSLQRTTFVRLQEVGLRPDDALSRVSAFGCARRHAHGKAPARKSTTTRHWPGYATAARALDHRRLTARSHPTAPSWLALSLDGHAQRVTLRVARSFPQSFHQASRDTTGARWLDSAPDLTCEEDTPRHPLDGRKATHNRSVVGSRRPRLLQSLI
jgi:hypothetical protein